MEEYLKAPPLVRIPLVRAGKIPLVARWSSLPPDSPVWAQIFAEHPGCNVGIRLDQFVVADCDSERSVERWMLESPTSTPLISVGRPGRAAFWYRLPPDSGLRMCRVRPDLEIRTGPGAQQVVPPSVHPTGATYHWVRGSEEDLHDLPLAPEDWILSQAPAVSFSGLGGAGYDVVEDGGRDDFLIAVGGLLRAKGMGTAGIRAGLAAINQALCVPPKTAGDVERIATSASRYGVDEILTIDDEPGFIAPKRRRRR